VYASSRLWIIALLLGVVTLGIMLAVFVGRVIARPLAQAVIIARTVAEGDLTSTINPVGTDETGQLMQALKDMNSSLVRIVGQVRSGTDIIGTASAEIAAGNLDLSSRTEQQASSLEETASSMEELTSTVKQNADNARQANQMAASASAVAQEHLHLLIRISVISRSPQAQLSPSAIQTRAMSQSTAPIRPSSITEISASLVTAA
jgi:methyl-accepting chemotaxis protein